LCVYWQAVQRDFSSSPAPSYLVYYRLKAIRPSPADPPTLERFATIPSRADLPSSSPPLRKVPSLLSPLARDRSSSRSGPEERPGTRLFEVTSPQKKTLTMEKEDSGGGEEEERKETQTRGKDTSVLLEDRREKNTVETPGDRNRRPKKDKEEEEGDQTISHPATSVDISSSSSCNGSPPDRNDVTDEGVDFSISFSVRERERIADWLKSIRVNHPDFEIFKSKGIVQQQQQQGGGGGVWGNR
ncbi:hypothetical protein CSUI_004691, partial [Cystoisospora suis]